MTAKSRNFDKAKQTNENNNKSDATEHYKK